MVHLNFATIDDSDYPILRIKINAVNPTDEELDEFMAEVTTILNNYEGPYVSITDTADAVFVSKSAKEKLAGFASQSVETFNGRQKCSIVIVNTDVVRVMLKGLGFFFPKNHPEKIVGNTEEAEEIAKEVLQEHGLFVE